MSPSPISTRWIVLTGAPCSGKTTLLEELARRGFAVVPETARALIESELGKGRTLKQIRRDPLAFQRRVLRRGLRTATGLRPEQPLFLDRGLLDCAAYLRFHGLDPGEAMDAAKHFQYAAVLLLERLPFEKDAVRSEDKAATVRLETLLADAYRRAGYRPLRLPVLPVPERADRAVALLGEAGEFRADFF